jgi:hypothetical protein
MQSQSQLVRTVTKGEPTLVSGIIASIETGEDHESMMVRAPGYTHRQNSRTNSSVSRYASPTVHEPAEVSTRQSDDWRKNTHRHRNEDEEQIEPCSRSLEKPIKRSYERTRRDDDGPQTIPKRGGCRHLVIWRE